MTAADGNSTSPTAPRVDRGDEPMGGGGPTAARVSSIGGMGLRPIHDVLDDPTAPRPAAPVPGIGSMPGHTPLGTPGAEPSNIRVDQAWEEGPDGAREPLPVARLSEAQSSGDDGEEADPLEGEFDVLGGMLRAAETKKIRKVRIMLRRPIPDPTQAGKIVETDLFPVVLVGLDEPEQMGCYDKAQGTEIGPNGRPELDAVAYRSWILYTATVEDVKTGLKCWDHPRLRGMLRRMGNPVMNGIDAIDALLLAGEKAELFNVVNTLSGGRLNLEAQIRK